MKPPRLIYYNDAHHYHAKRVEPPVSRHKLKQPVDELLGTGVDLLVLGLGYGDVYFHNSKVGRTVGEKRTSGKISSTGASCAWCRTLKSRAQTRLKR